MWATGHRRHLDCAAVRGGSPQFGNCHEHRCGRAIDAQLVARRRTHGFNQHTLLTSRPLRAQLFRRSEMNTLKNFVKDEQGLETVEYAIITGLIVAGVIATIAAIGAWVSLQFSNLKTELGA